MTRTIRPWISGDHLRGVASGDAGAIMVRPLRAGEIYFDAASANHLPANLPAGEHGSSILDIGQGVSIRASGNARLTDAGDWEIPANLLHASQYPTGRELTRLQADRARTVIGALISDWARTHEGDIAQADDIERNNGAHRLETQIARHEDALAILLTQLDACEQGESYSMYPQLPTDGR